MGVARRGDRLCRESPRRANGCVTVQLGDELSEAVTAHRCVNHSNFSRPACSLQPEGRARRAQAKGMRRDAKRSPQGMSAKARTRSSQVGPLAVQFAQKRKAHAGPAPWAQVKGGLRPLSESSLALDFRVRENSHQANKAPDRVWNHPSDRPVGKPKEDILRINGALLSGAAAKPP